MAKKTSRAMDGYSTGKCMGTSGKYVERDKYCPREFIYGIDIGFLFCCYMLLFNKVCFDYFMTHIKILAVSVSSEICIFNKNYDIRVKTRTVEMKYS